MGSIGATYSSGDGKRLEILGTLHPVWDCLIVRLGTMIALLHKETPSASNGQPACARRADGAFCERTRTVPGSVYSFCQRLRFSNLSTKSEIFNPTHLQSATSGRRRTSSGP